MEADPMTARNAAVNRPFDLARNSPATDAPPRQAALHAVDQGWRYLAAFWRGRLANLLGGHRLLPTQARRHAAEVTVSEALRLRWQRLFDVPAAAAEAVPFLYAQSVGLQLYTRTLGDMGVNLRHLTHLRHQTEHLAGTAHCAQERRLRLVGGLRQVWRLGSHKALIELQIDVMNADGRPLARVQDSFVARQLPSTDTAALPVDTEVVSGLSGLRQRRPQLELGAAGACTRWLSLERDFGHDYGRVSGDFDPGHTGWPRDRLPGSRHLSVPTLGLRDLVVRHLSEMGAPLDHLSLSYVKPARPGKSLCLVVQAPRLELHDERGHLVAFGEARAQA
jgi:hypothetical protein